MGHRQGKECLILHPDCCRDGKLFIFASYDEKEIEWEFDNLDVLRSNKPIWYIRAETSLPVEDKDWCAKPKPVTICPWCRKDLPDLVLNPAAPPDDKIAQVDCNGYYCACGERAGHCNCIDPIILWKVEEKK